MTTSKHQVSAALKIVLAVSEAIRELHTVPSGHLYAQLCGKLTMEQYEGVIRTLKGARLIEESSANELRWIGPEVRG